MTAPRQARSNAACLFVLGSDSEPRVSASGNFEIYPGNNDLYPLLGLPGVPRLLLRPDSLDQRARPHLRYRCLVNQISDPDRNPLVLESLGRLVRGFTGRIVNHPRHVLKSTRDEMAKQLAGTPGLIVPKVVRCRPASPEDAVEAVEAAGLSFPIILRRAGTHGGRIIGLLADMDDLRRAVPSEGELIATEFVEFRSDDGIYRKYRIFVFGRLIVLRHMLASDEWNIHARDRQRFMLDRPDLRDEERQVLERPRHAFDASATEALKAVRNRIGLDYYGMDFGIAADGRLILFEANATMNIFPFATVPEFAYLRLCLPLARRACRAMLLELATTIETGTIPRSMAVG